MSKPNKHKTIKIICGILSFVCLFFIFMAVWLIRSDAITDKALFSLRIHVIDKDDATVIPYNSLVIIKHGAAYKDGTQVEAVYGKTSRITSAAYAKEGIIGTCIAVIPVGGIIKAIAYTPVLSSIILVLFTLLCIIIITSTPARSKMKKQSRLRGSIQALFSVATNSYLMGFAKGTIYKGKLKAICVPGLNCYSCPGAYGACPIGAMQAVLNRRTDYRGTLISYISRIPFYALGAIMLFGVVCGRLVCGFLCPFGWIQDLLYKIPIPKKAKIRKFRGDRQLRYLKYVILILFVVILPFAAKTAYPWFCKLICPGGMLLGGIPLMSLNSDLANAAGGYTVLKMAILAIIVLFSVSIYRPFCKYLCPLGAIYGLLNKCSIYHYNFDKDKCTDCGACRKICKMGVDMSKGEVHSAECIRCGKCISICKAGAISASFSIPSLKKCDEIDAMKQ